jgi:hypothetical protein
MRRRDFLAASTLAAIGMAGSRTSDAAEEPSGRQYFELRTYHFASAHKQQAYEQFLAEAGIPACNRAGVEPVGVWKLLAKDNPNLRLAEDDTNLHVFLTHKNIESVVTMENRLAEDEVLQKAGEAVLRAPKTDPTYTRYESTLLLAMEGAPTVVVPEKTESRVFELRTYESPTNERALNKLEMFNAGEFEIFKKAGMPGVFFGGAIVGQNLPQLTYMVVHATREDAGKNWAAFNRVPEWKKLTANPSYKDNVSRVHNPFLRPAASSQI